MSCRGYVYVYPDVKLIKRYYVYLHYMFAESISLVR